MENLAIKLYFFENIRDIKNFFLKNFPFKFSILQYNEDEFNYSILCSTIFNKDEFFFDTEILETIPYKLNDIDVCSQITFHYKKKFLLLIHEPTKITEKEINFFKHFIISYQKLNIIKNYENLLSSRDSQINLLNEIGDILGDFNLEIVLTKILENAVSLVNGDVGAIYLYEKGSFEEKIAWGLPKGIINNIINIITNNTIIEEIYQNKEPILIYDFQKNEEYEFKLKDKYLINSFLGLPLYTKNKNLGVLILINFIPDEDFTKISLKTLETLTQIASVGIENAIFFKDSIEKEKLLTELSIAANLQQQLLPPENFSDKKFLISSSSFPARNVGGDFFNYLLLNEKEFVGFVGDVSGKGIPAALLTTMALTLLKTLLLEFNDLKQSLFKLNNIIANENLGEKYFTLGIFKIDAISNNVELINAGHTDILHFNVIDKKIVKYRSLNLPIGMFEDIEYESVYFETNPGDLLILYSDGIPDALNESNERYGIERMISIVKDNYNLTAEEIKNRILEDVKSFSKNTEQFDDLTIMVLKLL